MKYIKTTVIIQEVFLPRLDFESLRQRVQETYNAPVARILPVSEEMIELGSADLVSLEYPEHPYSQEVRQVAEQILSAA